MSNDSSSTRPNRPKRTTRPRLSSSRSESSAMRSSSHTSLSKSRSRLVSSRRCTTCLPGSTTCCGWRSLRRWPFRKRSGNISPGFTSTASKVDTRFSESLHRGRRRHVSRWGDTDEIEWTPLACCNASAARSDRWGGDGGLCESPFTSWFLRILALLLVVSPSSARCSPWPSADTESASIAGGTAKSGCSWVGSGYRGPPEPRSPRSGSRKRRRRGPTVHRRRCTHQR